MRRAAYPVLLTLIIALGAYLRLVDLGGPSLWLDEILHLQVAQSLADEPWYAHLTGVSEIKGGTENGALYYRLQVWGQKLAPGEVGVRLFPAVVGIATLPLMAWTGFLLGGRLVAVAATSLLAMSPLHVYFCREGRPYYLLMAAALLLLCLLLQQGSPAGLWKAYGGCLLTAYVGIHSIPILLSFAVLSAIALGWSGGRRMPLRRSPQLHYLAASILALGLAYGLYMTRSKVNAPVLEMPQKQVEIQRAPGFRAPLSTPSLKMFLASMTTSGHPSVPMGRRSWVLIALAAVGLAGCHRRRALVATAGMFLLPAALSASALLSVGRWYGIRYTSPALPAFLLLVAAGIAAASELVARLPGISATAARQAAATRGTAATMLLVCVAPNLTAALHDPHRKLDWRGVARFFDDVTLEGEPVIVPNLWPQICLDHYLRILGREVEFVHVWESAAIAETEVAARPRGWLLTAGFRKKNEVREWMHRFVPVLKKRQEEMALFFFPDFTTLLESRFAAGKGALFERRFAAMDQRFEFDGEDTLLQGLGWSYAERNRRGTSFQWAVGERAELGLPIGRPRDAVIRFRALPFPLARARPRLEAWLGDCHLATLELPLREWSEHRLEVPATSWSPGANVLDLRFHREAAAEASQNPRNLSVAFDYLEVVP